MARSSQPNSQESADKIKKLNAIHFIWDQQETAFLSHFRLLSNWLKVHNNKYPSKMGGPEERFLYTWVRTMRFYRKKGLLSIEKIEMLDSIGFIWEPEILEQEVFSKRVYELIEWLKIHDKYPSRYSKNNFEKILGDWVNHLRATYKKGKLPKDKVEKLESIGFIWEVPNDSFSVRFNELSTWLETHNGEYPSTRIFQDNAEKSLADWIHTIRKERKKGTLSQDKIDKLDSLEFIWRPNANRFQNNFNNLVTWLKTHNHIYPTGKSTLKTDPLEKSILNWMSYIRQQYKIGKMSQDQIEKLNRIRFDWDPAWTKLSTQDDSYLDSFDEYYHFV
jgi:hypothetical protein